MTAEQNCERLLLLIRAAVVDKEMCAINAMHQTMHGDGWLSDWNAETLAHEIHIQKLHEELAAQ